MKAHTLVIQFKQLKVMKLRVCVASKSRLYEIKFCEMTKKIRNNVITSGKGVRILHFYKTVRT